MKEEVKNDEVFNDKNIKVTIESKYSSMQGNSLSTMKNYETSEGLLKAKEYNSHNSNRSPNKYDFINESKELSSNIAELPISNKRYNKLKVINNKLALLIDRFSNL